MNLKMTGNGGRTEMRQDDAEHARFEVLRAASEHKQPIKSTIALFFSEIGCL